MADDKKSIPDAGKVDEPPKLGEVEPAKAVPPAQDQLAPAEAESPVIEDASKMEDAPALVKKIGKTTYKVRVHFSQTSTEIMSDKIKRMLKNEIQQLN